MCPEGDGHLQSCRAGTAERQTVHPVTGWITTQIELSASKGSSCASPDIKTVLHTGNEHDAVHQIRACARALSRLTLCDPWTIAHQVSLSMGFSRQEYWNGLPFPPPRTFPDPEIEPVAPAALTWAGGFFITEPPGKPQHKVKCFKNKTKILLILNVELELHNCFRWQ